VKLVKCVVFLYFEHFLLAVGVEVERGELEQIIHWNSRRPDFSIKRCKENIRNFAAYTFSCCVAHSAFAKLHHMHVYMYTHVHHIYYIIYTQSARCSPVMLVYYNVYY
jgi:hypothetical protein